jgi:hypothetical protein
MEGIDYGLIRMYLYSCLLKLEVSMYFDSLTFVAIVIITVASGFFVRDCIIRSCTSKDGPPARRKGPCKGTTPSEMDEDDPA